MPQVRTFGPGSEPPPLFNWRLSADYLRLPVLRALFHAVSERGALNTVQIIEVLDHATDALNRVQPAFFETFNEEDAVNYFYEPFLEAFDPELRKQLGVWYTPREIVRYMVERVDHLLRTELHVRFFRIAERRIVGDAIARGNRNGRGLVSFISNNAWLDGLSHVSMRARYLNEFQSIYIDNLNGDKYRTGKTTPDGHPDPSAFSTPQNREGIQVGTAITTLVRTATPRTVGSPGSSTGTSPNLLSFRSEAEESAVAFSDPGSMIQTPPDLSFRSAAEESASPPTSPRNIHQIQLRNIWGSHKLSHLDREARREISPTYTPVNPVPTLGLPYAQRTHTAAYNMWPRLPELFRVSFSGIKTSRDALLVDIDEDKLEERMRAYLNPGPTETNDLQLETTSRFDAKAVRESLQMRPVRAYKGVISSQLETKLRSFAFRPWQIRKYLYRPFDMRWLYWEPETKLLDESAQKPSCTRTQGT